MMTRFRDAGLIWPTVFALPALAVLLTLGAWQWQRKTWKQGLLAQLEQSAAGKPSEARSLFPYHDADEIRFRRITLKGQFLHDRELHVWVPRDNGEAWRIVTPLRLSEPVQVAASRTITHVLIIRGLVDQAHKLAGSRASGQVRGGQTVVGRVRFGSANWATPTADIAGNKWYALQPAEMSSVALGQKRSEDVAPFLVEAETASGAQPTPQPDLKQLHLSNRHLEYALTWWALALTLIGVYVAFTMDRMRRLGDQA